MGFGGKADREWLEPLTEEGSLNEEDPDMGAVLGCHRGAHEWLNIYGAQRGYTYVWERKKPNDLRKALMRGGELVKDDDPEMIAGRKASGDLVTSVDSMAEYNELQLVRYSERATRKIREGEEQRRERMLKGSAESYLDKMTHGEQASEWNPRSVRTRFSTSEHRLEQRSNNNVESQWSPDGDVE